MDIASIISVIVILGLIWTAAFFSLAPIIWTSLIGISLLTITIFGYFSLGFLLICWLLFLLVAGFANLRSWRIQYITTPALTKLKKQMPTISDTERAAIEAGDTWWEKELFCGQPKWRDLLNIPRPTLSEDEENFLNNQVEHLCSLINDWEIMAKDHNLSPQAWDYLKAEKFFGMVIPKQYGGLGFSALAHSTVVTKIASRSISAAVTTMVPNSLGPAELLVHYGTEEQKNYYLPKLAAGEEIPCFALTGPDAGSDAGAIPDTGIVCKGQFDGKEVLGIRLSWDKRYITLAPVATVLGIAFRLFDPDKLLGKVTDIGITLCLVPTSHPGVEVGNRHLPMYLSFMNGPTRGKDVFIPLDWIIGGVEMAGQGWRMLMECLSIGRSISLPALATGSSKVAYRFTGAYSRVRRQFNTSLSSFEGIEEALGYIAGYTYILEATRTMTAGAVDQKINPAIVSAIAKYQMTEMCRSVVGHGMDIQAGHAIQVGPRNFLANIYAAVPISITVEGANILTRNLIIFGQGAIRCHPYLLKEVELITAPKPDVDALDKVLMSHIGFYVGNVLRAFAYGLTGGYFIFNPIKNRRIRRYARQLTRMSTALAIVADTSLLILGGSLKRRERISARLADVLSQLYLSSAVLKFYHDNKQSPEEVDYVCWALQESLFKIQTALDELFLNFPQRVVGSLLRFIIFPFGAAYTRPSDRLHKAIIMPMLAPTALRERLTKYCFISPQEDDTGNRLDKALTSISTMEPIWKKLNKAMQEGHIPDWYPFDERVYTALKLGILTADEVSVVMEFEPLRNEVIKVNEFSFDLNQIIA